ncbi:MAG: MFS transporter [Bacteroidales bacterium]|nr:MFS transporter [Bacteroidales bacterium]
MNKSIKFILPVLITYFVMGFCDVVGIATSYAKVDFQLTDKVAGFIPSMVFIWFLFLSVPSGLLMNKLGRKNVVQLSNLITIIAMVLPLIHYSFPVCMIAFVLLGIGNTILQVALNPLMSNVVSGETLTSSLTAGQVVKAVSSFCGPFIALFASTQLGSWMYIFPIYAAITLLVTLWLQFTAIPKEEITAGGTSVAESFALLKDPKILLLFFGIFFVVGVDVGTNTVSAKLMIERAGWVVEKAGLAASVYFISRTVGAFLGSFLLAKVNDSKYLLANVIGGALTIAALFVVKAPIAILVCIGLIGFFFSSVFSILFSAALKAKPDKSNEISGFLITAVSGGAVIPPAMGMLSDAMGSQAGSLVVIGACIAYLVACSLWLLARERK